MIIGEILDRFLYNTSGLISDALDEEMVDGDLAILERVCLDALKDLKAISFRLSGFNVVIPDALIDPLMNGLIDEVFITVDLVQIEPLVSLLSIGELQPLEAYFIIFSILARVRYLSRIKADDEPVDDNFYVHEDYGLDTEKLQHWLESAGIIGDDDVF